MGEDSKYLTEEEVISSHNLFGSTLYDKLNNKKTFEGEDDNSKSELEYLSIIRNIRDKQPELYERIKRMPKKARTARHSNLLPNSLISFFRKGKLKKFYTNASGGGANEIDFLVAVDYFLCSNDAQRITMPRDYYQLLDKNKQAFEEITSDEINDTEQTKGGRSNASFVIKYIETIRKYSKFTEEDEEYLRDTIQALKMGTVPKKKIQVLKQELEKENNPIKAYAILKSYLHKINNSPASSSEPVFNKREIILSLYLKEEPNAL